MDAQAAQTAALQTQLRATELALQQQAAFSQAQSRPTELESTAATNFQLFGRLLDRFSGAAPMEEQSVGTVRPAHAAGLPDSAQVTSTGVGGPVSGGAFQRRSRSRPSGPGESHEESLAEAAARPVPTGPVIDVEGGLYGVAVSPTQHVPHVELRSDGYDPAAADVSVPAAQTRVQVLSQQPLQEDSSDEDQI